MSSSQAERLSFERDLGTTVRLLIVLSAPAEPPQVQLLPESLRAALVILKNNAHREVDFFVIDFLATYLNHCFWRQNLIAFLNLRFLN